VPPTTTPTPGGPDGTTASLRIIPPVDAPDLPGGLLTLIDPISAEIPPSHGPTTFVWDWTGDSLPSKYGFEVRVWLPGEPQASVHDAVLENRAGLIEKIGPNRYQLKVGDIRFAEGVLGREGIYNWTVAIVQISPDYSDLDLQAVPTRFKYEPFPAGR
jgi:hypothetical protein